MWWLADTVWRGCVGGGAAPATGRCISCSYSHNPPHTAGSRCTCQNTARHALDYSSVPGNSKQMSQNAAPTIFKTGRNVQRQGFGWGGVLLNPQLNRTHTTRAGTRCDWSTVWSPRFCTLGTLKYDTSAPAPHGRNKTGEKLRLFQPREQVEKQGMSGS